MSRASALDILAGLNDAQREAVTAVTGPVAIAAGAGTGKTRVVSHRAAYAVASGAVDERRILLVTFTEKAAREMADRVRVLGLGAVTARTFHSAALAQLRHFWPRAHGDAPFPDILADPWRLVAPLARNLPGGYRFTPTKDLIDEIAWAASRRIRPTDYAAAITAPGSSDARTLPSEARTPPTEARTPPIPVELFARVYRDYERAKARRGVIDFDDILVRLVDLLEGVPGAVEQVHARYAWFTVDEFQDTTPLQYRLLELWLGERRDLCVVGDEDQTIYSFAGATPAHLREFERRFPGARVIPLTENYRSSPQVLSLANRLLATTGREKALSATRPAGPDPTIRVFADDGAELAGIVAGIGRLGGEGVAHERMAVLVRLNAQLAPIEAALMRAGIPYEVRGERFFDRPEIKAAIDQVRRLPSDLCGETLVDAAAEAWRGRLGFEAEADVKGAEGRERQAAMATLLALVRESATRGSAAGPREGRSRDEVLNDLALRASGEREGSGGMQLLTLHRAKGLEWDAVFLPALEEGLLPVGQAVDDPDALDEERRLLYVGITRARTHLALSWAQLRPSTTGKPQRRTMSRFLCPLMGVPRVAARSTDRPAAAPPTRERRAAAADTTPMSAEGAELFEVLKAWRLERARSDGLPAYVILHDATLRTIAERRPTTLAELADIAGVGPAKLARYGADIIELVEQGRA